LIFGFFGLFARSKSNNSGDDTVGKIKNLSLPAWQKLSSESRTKYIPSQKTRGEKRKSFWQHTINYQVPQPQMKPCQGKCSWILLINLLSKI